MSNEMSVVFKGGHLEARSVGDKSYQTAVALWAEVTRVCREHDCYRVLGVAESDQPMSTMDSMNHVKLFKDFSITRQDKIAWVELNAHAVGSVRFLEAVLTNRDLVNGRLFDDVDEARAWLLEE